MSNIIMKILEAYAKWTKSCTEGFIALVLAPIWIPIVVIMIILGKLGILKVPSDDEEES